jgi:hypothetical protein
MQNIDEILGQIKLPERIYPLCLRADLRGRWEELNRKLRHAEAEATSSLAGEDSSGVAEQIRDLEEEMAAATVNLQLRALRSKAWSDLLAKHPPRKDHERDRAFNLDTFGSAMLAACSVDPIMSEDQAGHLIDSITQGQWDELTTVLWNLNNAGVDVPKSRLASEILQGSRKK